ncbi:hypothetical protein FQA47_001889 [Oryzias melastigma]|uniref:Uncharacterized protein n=1 Tax=Oryzias melastigma TaxID=30732 RepID=A0A834FGZ8_ORYME|nr:hypothetical protein FQA47_001889 [Oryzias melastigma]
MNRNDGRSAADRRRPSEPYLQVLQEEAGRAAPSGFTGEADPPPPHSDSFLSVRRRYRTCCCRNAGFPSRLLLFESSCTAKTGGIRGHAHRSSITSSQRICCRPVFQAHPPEGAESPGLFTVKCFRGVEIRSARRRFSLELSDRISELQRPERPPPW